MNNYKIYHKEEKMSLDRSYNPYEVIRVYHNRKNKVIQLLPHYQIPDLVIQSFSNQVQIKIK